MYYILLFLPFGNIRTWLVTVRLKSMTNKPYYYNFFFFCYSIKYMYYCRITDSIIRLQFYAAVKSQFVYAVNVKSNT